MEMKLNLELGEYQLIELRRMAAEARTDIAGIVTGIVKLYLAGKGASVPVTPAQVQLVRDICAAVDNYRGGTIKPSRAAAPSRRAPSSQKRIGRPPVMTDEQVEFARDERAHGLTYAAIGNKLGVGEWAVRAALARATRA
jgi:hypothetical protein